MSHDENEIDDTGERLIPKGNKQTLTYGEHISRYNAVLEMVRGMDVLDVASGAGYGSKLISQYAKSVQGLDNSEDAVEYARKYYSSPNLTYTLGDAQNIPFSDNTFDIVVSFETIEHLPNPDQFISEVKRVLKSTGIFVVSTPNDDEFMDSNEFHVHEFQLSELKNLIKNNFTQQQYYYQGTYFASGVFDKDTFIKGTNEPINLQTYITFGQPQSKSIYFLAVASNSDKELPNLNQNIVVADRWSTKEDLERDKVRNDHSAQLEKDIKTKEATIADLKKKADNFDRLKETKIWKVLKFINQNRKKSIKLLNKLKNIKHK